MNIIKGIVMICKLKNINKRTKAKAIGCGILETILNAPKTILSWIPLAIGAIFGALGELFTIISEPLLNFATWLKWDTKDIVIAPKELINELQEAIKKQVKKTIEVK